MRSHHSRHHDHHHEHREHHGERAHDRNDHRSGYGRHFFRELGMALRQHAMGRHGHRHGPGSGGGPFSDDLDGFGGDGQFPRSRKFSSDDLQLLLLALLEEKPSHGYELTRALEVRSSGFYKPSPGMIYPALTYLEEIGYATVEVVSNKKCYHLAEPGRTYLAQHRERSDYMFAKLARIGRKMQGIRASLAERDSTDPADANWLPEYIEARRSLKHLLVTRGSASAEEQRRIAAILNRAASEIRDATRAEGGAAPDEL